MEQQDSTSESQVMRVYNLVCPERVQDFFQNKLNTIGGIGVKGGPFGNEWQDWETGFDNPFLPGGTSMRNDEQKVREWKEIQREKKEKLKEEEPDKDDTELDGDNEDDNESSYEDGNEDGNEGDAKQPTLHDHEQNKVDEIDKSLPKDRGTVSVGRNKNHGSSEINNETGSREPKQSKGDPYHARESWLDDKQKRSEIGADDSDFAVKAATDRNKAYQAEVDVVPDNYADRYVDIQGFRG